MGVPPDEAVPASALEGKIPMNQSSPDSENENLLITAKQVADLLQISPRSVWRMRSAGSMPTPIRLGAAVRWRRDQIEAWIRDGCPSPSRNA